MRWSSTRSPRRCSSSAQGRSARRSRRSSRASVPASRSRTARHSDYSVMQSAIVTDPELCSVGLTEQEARDAGYSVDVVKHPLPNVTRAQYTRTKHGLYKIVFDPETRRVLGVHVVSRNARGIVGSLP